MGCSKIKIKITRSSKLNSFNKKYILNAAKSVVFFLFVALHLFSFGNLFSLKKIINQKIKPDMRLLTDQIILSLNAPMYTKRNLPWLKSNYIESKAMMYLMLYIVGILIFLPQLILQLKFYGAFTRNTNSIWNIEFESSISAFKTSFAFNSHWN